VDNKPAFPELFKFLSQGSGSVQRIIIKDILPPAVEQTGRFFRAGMITGGDKEKIIFELRPIGQLYGLLFGLNLLNLPGYEFNTPGQQSRPPSQQVFRLIKAKRHKQKARLIIMVIIPVNYGYLPAALAERPGQFVSHNRPACSSSQNDQIFHCFFIPLPSYLTIL